MGYGAVLIGTQTPTFLKEIVAFIFSGTFSFHGIGL
jgi:hypothetical protein